MTKQTKDKLNRLNHTLRTALGVASILVLLLLVLAAFNTPFKHIFIYIFYACGIIWILLFCFRVILTPFVKSDEEEEFEQKIDYILQKKAEQSATDYTPLRQLPPPEQEKIEHLLRDLPEHPTKPGNINLAFIAHYLTALEHLGLADLKDKHHLRLWVARVTGKQVPNSSQFNEAIPSKSGSKITKARKDIEKLLQ